MAQTPERRIRLLFIDDDGSIRIFAAAMFNDHLFDIRVAADTREADSYRKSLMFDIIVCDVMMPEESGIQYCHRLRKAGCKTPFLFLSALGDSKTVSEGLAAGSQAYFVKPIDARELQKKIIDIVVPTQGDRKTPDPNASKKNTNWFGR